MIQDTQNKDEHKNGQTEWMIGHNYTGISQIGIWILIMDTGIFVSYCFTMFVVHFQLMGTDKSWGDLINIYLCGLLIIA